MQMFQQKVLNQVKKIPKGKVTTYKELGKALHTKAYRAIGQALKNNPTPIIIPCHRVINSNGDIGGYCGKKDSSEKIKLLEKEGITIKNRSINNSKYLYRFLAP